MRGRRTRTQRTGAPPSALHTRPYEPGDERAILRLFRSIFRQHKSLSRWRWEFLENPYGRTNVTVLVSDRGEIVGHYGGILVRVNCQGAVMPASQIVDVMIHPDHRGRAALARLALDYLRDSRDNGVRFLYGFNGSVTARSNRRFFGAELAPVSEWVRDLTSSPDRCVAPGDQPHVRRVVRFDVRVDALWEGLVDRYPCAVVRDSRYLNWRYSHRADREYVLWQAADPGSGRIVAVAVLGGTRSDGLILELLADPDDAQSVTALLRGAIGHFCRAGRLRVRTWLPPYGSLRHCAEAVGFAAVQPRLHLNLLALDSSLDATALTRNLYLTLGDYDVP